MIQRTGLKNSHIAHGKADRLNAAKQQRTRKRAELLESRRTQGPPCLVAILPLSDDVDVQVLWDGLLTACREDNITSSSKPSLVVNAPTAAADGGGSMEVDDDDDDHKDPSTRSGNAISTPLAPITMSLPERRKVKFTFLPPPVDRTDPLAVVEIGRAAEVVLFVLPGDARAVAVDKEGQTALAVLRSMGLPSSVAIVQTSTTSNATSTTTGNLMKERSAAKKRATEAFSAELPGDYRVLSADTSTDFKQILRHLTDSPHAVPLWRRQRPQLVAEAADFLPDPSNTSVGRLVLTGYIRGHGLSAVQAVHIPTAGDFQIDHIDACAEPAPANESPGSSLFNKSGGNGVAAMEAEASNGGILAQVAPEARESLVRENEPDMLDGEQTWPTEEELKDAEREAAAAAATKRRLPKGTSDYQAAWILDNDDDGDEEEEFDDGGSLPDLELNTAAVAPGDGANTASLGDDFNDSWQNMDGGATEIDMDYADEDDEDALDTRAAKIKARRDAQEDELKYPDEVDTPLDIPARKRFARYRGLKSFRTSPWDPKEDLPQEYARVFAFENFKRTLKRAREAAAKIEPGKGVLPGAFVSLHAAAVPADAALRVVERIRASQSGAACVLSAWGLLQHECKLSVVNFGIKKVSNFTEPVANKEELLFVTGLRSFMARPILSTDEHGADKHKMERFLLEGRPSMATIFSPISYPPLPLLAFKPRPNGQVALAATGALRDCNPDRVVLKKIVLTGYPVKAHKSKAVVKWMFHTPEDVRWFRPVELWTKDGRRGRIREPLGTHGTMKCIFDGPIQQQDAVCMSLYKRAYPKWPFIWSLLK